MFSRIKLLQNRSDFTILKKGSNLAEQGTERTRSKTRKTRKFFSKIFKSEFSIFALGQNQKLGNKKTRNNISKVSEISEISEFLICTFFILFLNFFYLLLYIFFSGSLFYICNKFYTLSHRRNMISYVYILIYKIHSQQRV